MKFERFLKMPRSSRTIHLVINIPESPALVSPPSKLTGWARMWAVLKVAGPSSVAIAAIIISILSLRYQGTAIRDQLQTDAAAAAASQRHAAEQVSFLQNNISKPPFTDLLVENLSTNPVYDVSFEIIATAGPANEGGGKIFNLWLGNMPACSESTIGITEAALAGIEDAKNFTSKNFHTQGFGIVVEWMSFADSNGNAWLYSGGQKSLQHLTSFPKLRLIPPENCKLSIEL